MSLRKAWMMTLLVLFGAMQAMAEEADRGHEIAKENIMSDAGFGSSSANLVMVLKNKAGAASERTMTMYTYEMNNEGDGDKTIIRFSSPRDIDGTSLLSHAKVLEPDGQWLYLPAIKRVKRLSTANKSGPFMGSEFAYEDITADELGKYTYRYQGEEIKNGIDCYVVERTPIYERSGYSRQVVWFDKEYKQIRQIDYYDKSGAHAKTLTQSDYKLFEEKYWRALTLQMVNHKTGKETNLIFSDYNFGASLDEKMFEPVQLSRIR